MHYYQHHIGDYLADTTHLTLLEHGAYLRLMMLYYQTECALNANALRLICARSAEEVQATETVLNEFFTMTDLGWVHGRCDAEISRFHGKSVKAKASAKARWSNKDANAMRTHSEGNANQEPITNNQEPIKEKLSSSGDDLCSAKDEKQESKKLSAAECQQIADSYNSALNGALPKVTTLTPARQSAINARFREMLNSKNDRGQIRFSDKEGGIKWFGVFFGKVAKTPFLLGDSERGWKANFDWLIAPKNFLKIVEGGFDQ